MSKLLLLLLGLLLLGACKKVDSEPELDEKTALLTAKNWRLTAYRTAFVSATSGNASYVRDAYATMSPCFLDDFYTFKRDKTVIIDYGTVACTSTSLPTSVEHWDWYNNQTQLGFVNSTSPPSDLIELSPTTLRLKLKQWSVNGDSFTHEWTYTAF